VRLVAAAKPKLAGVFAHHAVDRVWVHPAALVLAPAVVLERSEEDPLVVGLRTNDLPREKPDHHVEADLDRPAAIAAPAIAAM
jgi:hypothetical protein